MNRKTMAQLVRNLWSLSEELGSHGVNIAKVRHQLELNASEIGHALFPGENLDHILKGKKRSGKAGTGFPIPVVVHSDANY